MKCGIIENIQIADLARKKGKILMIGGNIETALAMTTSAHFACGRGDFSFVDLDTPLWFSQKLWKGPSIGRKGLYDLSKVRAGLGMEPLPRLQKLVGF
jgi:L-alanine-DL-glutamate epimerase-like enolase superfamily enzyme